MTGNGDRHPIYQAVCRQYGRIQYHDTATRHINLSIYFHVNTGKPNVYILSLCKKFVDFMQTLILKRVLKKLVRIMIKGEKET